MRGGLCAAAIPRYTERVASTFGRLLGKNAPMALNIQEEIVRHQKGWEGFAKFTFFGTVAVIAIVGLMALTLL